MSNYHSTTCSWDLFCDLDLSDRVVPYLDLDCRDHTNVPYRVNSYALDFYRIGSDRLLEEENELQSGNIYNHLLDFSTDSIIDQNIVGNYHSERNETTLFNGS